jgi:hypothetical protein
MMRIADLRDYIYPMAEPLSEDEAERQEHRCQEQIQLTQSHSDPEALAQGYKELCDGETERLKSVEGRLGSILGLTSITASLLIGGIFAIVNGGLSDSSRMTRFVACAALFYLSLQIISSTLAAIRGLKRASWIAPSIEDYVPSPSVGPQEQHRLSASRNCNRLLQMERNIDGKVTQMAVAHTAIRNFASASVLIAALGCFAVLVQQPGSAAAKAIRSNPDLQKLLQGPPGPPGHEGAKGDPGPAASVTRKASSGHGTQRH